MPTHPYSGVYTHVSLGPQTSTDSWATLKEVDVQDWPNKFLRLANDDNNGNPVNVRVLASFDFGDNFPATLLSSSSINAGGSLTQEMTEAVSTIRIQIQSGSNGNPDDISGDLGLAHPGASK